MLNAFRFGEAKANPVEQLTRDVNVVPVHAHNNYWKVDGLFEALKSGCVSIESDIWKFPLDYTVGDVEFPRDGVYVGHNQVYLKPNETLNSLYLDPLYGLLGYSNPQVNYQVEPSTKKNGVFYNSPETSLYFWMDIKTEPEEALKAVNRDLQRFIDGNYLSYFDSQQQAIIDGPIVVTLTGNLPLETVRRQERIYTFLDAPLALFEELLDAELNEWARISRVASSSMQQLLGHARFFTQGLTDEDTATLKRFFDVAHAYGLKTRVWGGIHWPKPLADDQNMRLLRAGCDLVNLDDFLWGR